MCRTPYSRGVRIQDRRTRRPWKNRYRYRFASAGDQTYNSPPAKVETSQEPSERGRCLAWGVPPGHHSLPKNDLSRDTLQNDVTHTQQRRAVISLFISAAHALDHHETFSGSYLFVSFSDPLLQLKVGHYPVIFSIKVFGRRIYISTYSKNRCTVFYFRESSFRLHRGHEIPNITCSIRDCPIMIDMY